MADIQNVMKQMNEKTATYRSLAAIAAAAIIALGGAAAVAWKAGWIGSASGVPSRADAGDEPLGPNAGEDPSVDHQKIDDALDAASQYVNADRPGEAAKILESLHAKHPRHPRVLQQLYELRLFEDRTEEAYDLVSRLLDVGTDDPEQYWMAGTLAFQLDKFGQAASHYDKARSLDRTNPKYPLYLAQAHIRQHEYEKAKVELLRVIHLDGRVHEAYGNLAEIALIENKLDLAEQHLARARELEPDYFKWRVLESRILRRQGDPEEALRRLNAIADDRLQYHDSVVSERAQCWALLGEPEKAARAFVDQVNAYPQAWRSAVKAAEYYLIAEDETRARTWFNYAKKRAPAEAPEIDSLARRFKSNG